MYSAKDLEDIVLKYLQPISGIKGQIVRSDERIAGSDEDITVGLLSITDQYVQRAILLVTIFIKDFQVEGETSIIYKPNTNRFDLLVKKVMSSLNGETGKFWDFGNLWITNPGSPKYRNKDAQESFMTVRVEMKVRTLDSTDYGEFIFFGASDSIPVIEADIQALINSFYHTPVFLNTGNVKRFFSVVFPSDKKIKSVTDLDSTDFSDLTSQYIKRGNVEIDGIDYVIYTMEIAEPYQNSHVHQIDVENNVGELVYFGSSEAIPVNEGDLSNLDSVPFTTETIAINTGNEHRFINIVMKSDRNVVSIKDLDAGPFNDITGTYSFVGIITVGDDNYNVYTLELALPYTNNHRHELNAEY